MTDAEEWVASTVVPCIGDFAPVHVGLAICVRVDHTTGESFWQRARRDPRISDRVWRAGCIRLVPRHSRGKASKCTPRRKRDRERPTAIAGIARVRAQALTPEQRERIRSIALATSSCLECDAGYDSPGPERCGLCNGPVGVAVRARDILALLDAADATLLTPTGDTDGE